MKNKKSKQSDVFIIVLAPNSICSEFSHNDIPDSIDKIITLLKDKGISCRCKIVIIDSMTCICSRSSDTRPDGKNAGPSGSHAENTQQINGSRKPPVKTSVRTPYVILPALRMSQIQALSRRRRTPAARRSEVPRRRRLHCRRPPHRPRIRSPVLIRYPI